MTSNEPRDEDEPVVPADDEAQDAVDDDSDVEAHGGWGGALRPDS